VNYFCPSGSLFLSKSSMLSPWSEVEHFPQCTEKATFPDPLFASGSGHVGFPTRDFRPDFFSNGRLFTRPAFDFACK